MKSSGSSVLILGAWLFFAGGYVVVGLLLPPGSAQTALSYFLACLIPLFANAAFLWNAASPYRRRNGFWMLLALGCTLWLAGMLLVTYSRLVAHGASFSPFYVDLLFFLHTVPFMAALVGIYSPLFALLIYGLAKQRGLVARILSTPALVFLGEISFALYLVHLTVWSMMQGFNLEHPYIKQDSALNFLVCLSLSLAIATIFYKFIEVPYRKTLRKRWKTAPKVPVPDLCES